MPQEIEIEMIHRRRRSHRPMRVWRYHNTEGGPASSVVAMHIYTPSPYYFNPAGNWHWGGWGWVTLARRGGNEAEAWAYVIEFQDGTKGVCRVRDLNAALAELGARVDRRGDA